MTFQKRLKALVQRCVAPFGYRFERLRDTIDAPIDILDLLLTKESANRPDFFFIQIGANDGMVDDPIRHFVTRYHWRGVLVEPQPEVFNRLLQNYESEKQLIFENSAIADKDGVARMFVADHRDKNANLTVFASLKKEELISGLDHPRAQGVKVQVREIELPAVSVRTLLARHRIAKVDLLLTDVQGFDREIVEQFLACGVKPTIMHFEHSHMSRSSLDTLYRELVRHGYRFTELDSDSVCYLRDVNS